MKHIFTGDRSAETVLIQPVSEDEAGSLELEFAEISRLSCAESLCLAAVVIDDWDLDLSPWEAPAVFGKRPFGGGAGKTLTYITQTLVPQLTENGKTSKELYVGGYSLAGLFALWAVYESDLFKGAAAVSPSVWFPGFTEFAEANRLLAKRMYLSLGDKEEKARNPVMASVGDAIRKLDALYSGLGTEHILEWNAGNHFKEPELRTAKGFAWLLRKSAGNRAEDQKGAPL